VIVYISSPYGGKVENVALAAEAMRSIIMSDRTCIAPHVMLHRVLRDYSSDERDHALRVCCDLVGVCDEVWALAPGGRQTPGMSMEADAAKLCDKPVFVFHSLSELKEAL